MRPFIFGRDPFPEPPPYAPRYSRHLSAESDPMRREGRKASGPKRESKRKTLRTHRTGR